MQSIRKDDIVILADRAPGKVVGIVRTDALQIYKIERCNDRQIIYVDETKVSLKRQCIRSFVVMFSIEALNFIRYTLGG